MPTNDVAVPGGESASCARKSSVSESIDYEAAPSRYPKSTKTVWESKKQKMKSLFKNFYNLFNHSNNIDSLLSTTPKIHSWNW